MSSLAARQIGQMRATSDECLPQVANLPLPGKNPSGWSLSAPHPLEFDVSEGRRDAPWQAPRFRRCAQSVGPLALLILAVAAHPARLTALLDPTPLPACHPERDGALSRPFTSRAALLDAPRSPDLADARRVSA
jgi:hypothetical protein